MVFPSTPVQYQVQYRWSLYARFQCLLYVSSNTDSTSGSKIKGCSLQGFSIHDSKGCSTIASLTSIPVPSPRDYSTNGSKIQGCSSKDSCRQEDKFEVWGQIVPVPKTALLKFTAPKSPISIPTPKSPIPMFTALKASGPRNQYKKF